MWEAFRQVVEMLEFEAEAARYEVHPIPEDQAEDYDEVMKILFGDPTVPKPQGVINVPDVQGRDPRYREGLPEVRADHLGRG